MSSRCPRYDPWDQRLCVAPDGDLFAAIRDGRASVVTDQIDSLSREIALSQTRG
jgi:cation diffusion facilitator CzcD-associated flavoprotein CzcO